MTDLIGIIAIVAAIWGTLDVLRLMPAGVPRTLWLLAVIAVPILGPAYWYHTQYHTIRRRSD